MSQSITIYRREDRNTTPRGFGNPPMYHIDEPLSSDWDMVWVSPIDITLPEGYSVAECASGGRELYDLQDQRVEIVDDHGHPALLVDVRTNKRGKQYGVYQRLDE